MYPYLYYPGKRRDRRSALVNFGGQNPTGTSAQVCGGCGHVSDGEPCVHCLDVQHFRGRPGPALWEEAE